MNVIRRSQIIGLVTMDGSTATEYDSIEEVWLDEEGRVVYLAGKEGYTPLEQISVVGPDAVLTYSDRLFEPPSNLLHLNRMQVNSTMSDPLGWVEDFLFDWSTGDIAAYILGGDIAEPFGGKAVLFPDDIETIDDELAETGKHDRDILKEATEFLQNKWSDLQRNISRNNHRMRLALDSAWKKLAHK